MIVIAMHYSGHSQDHQFINNSCSQLKKKKTVAVEGRKQDLEVQAVWDLCKALPFDLLTQENIRRLCSQAE